MQGPFFGIDENHIIVMMQDEFIESFDGGATWKKLADTPKWVWSTYACAFSGYDPINDILYFSTRHYGGAHAWVYNRIYRLPLARWGTVTDVVPPTKPSNLRINVGLPGNRLNITWSPSTDASGINNYYVYKDGVLLIKTKDTTLSLRDLPYKTPYVFSVRAMDAFRNLSDSISTASATGDSLKSAYLSDLTWVLASPVTMDPVGAIPPRKDLDYRGNPITIINKSDEYDTYRKGLGVAACHYIDTSVIVYALGGQYNHFLSYIGVQEGSTMQFMVYADGVCKLQTSPTDMNAWTPAVLVDINIAGVDTLVLLLKDMGSPGNVYSGCTAAWADAMVVYDPSSTPVQNTALAQPATFGMTMLGSNPFSGSIPVKFQTTVAGNVKLSIYNLAGQLVKTVSNEARSAGAHTCVWDGRNVKGEKAISGVYLVRLETKTQSKTVKAVYLK
jgi:hypothetical protein